MTAKLISNEYYTGPNSVSSDSVIADTAAAIYSAYAARVTADGGAVNSPTDCQAAINAALVGDYWWRLAAAVSPDWGVKLSGSNITKLYSIKGTIDGVISGTIANDTTTFTKPLANLLSPALINFSGLNILASNADALAMLDVVTEASGSTLTQAAFTPVSDAWKIFGAGGSQFPQVQVNGVQKFLSSPEYDNPALIAHALVIEMGAQRITGIQNGTQMKSISASFGFTALLAGATASVAYGSGAGTPKMGELWFFNNASGLPGLQAITTATADVTARY